MEVIMNKKRLIPMGVCFAVCVGFILFTSPYHLPLLLIVVPGIAFIMAALMLLGLIVMKFGVKPRVRHITVNVLTAILAVLAILLSVGQLTFRDFTLLLALALIGMFYISRMLSQ